MLDRLSKILESSGRAHSGLRTITLELTCIVIRQLILAQDSETNLKSIEDTSRKSQEALVERLKNIIFTDDLFLEMFEDEYYNLEVTFNYST